MNNFYRPLKETHREPEYKNSSLKISSIGTEIKKNSGQMPDGSALLTDTGNNSSLKNQGINYIIHAVPRPRGSCASDEEFIKIAVKAVQNSIILADREKVDKLAICLVGGEAYRGSCDPKKLAEGIIRGAINQLQKVNNLKGISLIDWEKGSKHHLLEKTVELWKVGDLPLLSWGEDEIIFDALVYNPKGNRNIVVKAGDICNKNSHGASAIVNSENAGMGWGGGISGAIQRALGAQASNVDQQRKDLMKEFNRLINQPEEDDSVKTTWQGRYDCQGKDIFSGDSFFMFISPGIQNHPFLPREFTLSVSLDHPIFKGNPPKLGQKYKFSFKKADKDKGVFRKGDFIEVDYGGGTNYTCSQCGNNYNTKDKPLVENKYCSQDCKKTAERNKTKTCAFCSKSFDTNSSTAVIYNNKDYCSNECSLKQQEREKPSGPTDNLVQIQNSVLEAIQDALSIKPKLNNSDLPNDYQNWQNIIQQTNSADKINSFKEEILTLIKNQRQAKQASAERDERIKQARSVEEKINLLKEMGNSLGEHTPEQQVKLEQVKDELSSKPLQLREAIQKQIDTQMVVFKVNKENLSPPFKSQLEQLKNETDPTKIREIEKEVVQEIGRVYAEQTLVNLEQQVVAIIKNKNKNKIQELKGELLKIISSPNSFLQVKKSQAQTLLKKLEEGQQEPQNNNSSNQPKFPWKVVIPVSLVAVGVIVLIIVFKKIRKKSR